MEDFIAFCSFLLSGRNADLRSEPALGCEAIETHFFLNRTLHPETMLHFGRFSMLLLQLGDSLPEAVLVLLNSDFTGLLFDHVLSPQVAKFL